MSEPSDRLIAAELRAALEGHRVGNEIVVVEETASTNDLAWEAAQRGAREGFVVFAERQTKGRGQYGRQWESAPYLGLWLSVLLRPAMTMPQSPRLTSLLAETVLATITTETGVRANIKPPNDIYICSEAASLSQTSGNSRKVAGVLVEGRAANDGTYLAVAGIGINVNQTLDDFPEALRASAGSLAMALGRKIDRTKFAIALLNNLNVEALAPSA
jgi:BirA family biotin operon repressor/biotin-[acetyl-CoA-carboxylase] ligase